MESQQAVESLQIFRVKVNTVVEEFKDCMVRGARDQRLMLSAGTVFNLPHRDESSVQRDDGSSILSLSAANPG